MMLNKLSLNTIGLNRIGLNRIGKPSRGSSDRPYIDPEVLASLKAVCICYGKSNDDPDRAVVRNLVDSDNPFIISNAAFKLNSGFGKYEHDFTKWITNVNVSKTENSFEIIRPYYDAWVARGDAGYEFKQTKVYITGIPNGGNIRFARNATDGGDIQLHNGVNELSEFISTGAFGFYVSNLRGEWVGLKITQLPSFEGAFVTDGVEDLITSTKTVQEMGITKACTVISMIHHIDVPSDASFNNIRNSTAVSGRNGVYASGTTGIYGWSKDYVSGTSTTLINNILGDKNNYTNGGGGSAQVDNMKFSVQGFISDSGVISETSQVAWYWTVIANKVLTIDQINQVIAYFNLDRCVEPTVLYDVQKQGLTNETPAADWYLKDFSKNGFDMSLFNFAKKGDSGIGKYEVDFASLNYNNTTSVFTATYKSCSISKIIKDSVGNIFYNWGQTLAAINSTKIQVTGLDEIGAILEFTYLDESGNSTTKQYSTDGIYDLPASAAYQGDSHNANFRFSIRGYIGDCDITITQIPSHAGALCFDGVNDYGKVTGLPIYKDYTVIADYIRTFAKENVQDAPILSKSKEGGDGAFIFNYVDYSTSKTLAYSFANINNVSYINDFERNIYYQSKYTNNGNSINAGTGVDTNSMWLGTYRDNVQNYFTGAIYSLMTFPYSMSEFLIERQLKKRKAGTLYPDMVEFRPIVKSYLPYSSITYSVNPGEYISVGSMVTITVTLPNTSDKLMEVSCNAISDISISDDNGVYEITGKVVKSPQKINIVISSYLTMLNNETLISNETLIKNE